MEKITEKEVNELLERNRKEVQAIINAGGKVTNTTIYEKDKTTTIVKAEPVEGESTSSTIIQTRDSITLQKL